MSNDQSLFDVGAYGNDAIHTPHLDSLRKEGVLFTHAFTPSTLCVPSRATFLTGLYPHTSGVVVFYNERRRFSLAETLPRLMTDIGYQTYEVGKRQTWRVPFDLNNVYPFESRRRIGGKRPKDYALAVRLFLEDSRGEPFFMFVALRDPHRPFDRIPSVFRHDPETVLVPPFLFDTKWVRRGVANYWDAISRLDETLGQVLTELEESGRADDTIVIFTSDHGQPFPFAKATLYDAGMRVPFLVRWPGVVGPNTTARGMVSFVDVLPTLLEAIGHADKIPERIEGRSFLPLLLGSTQEGREEIIGTLTGGFEKRDRFPSRAIRTDRYKYIYNLPGGRVKSDTTWGFAWPSMREVCRVDPLAQARCKLYLRRPLEELYDLQSDPTELQNLADAPGLSAIKENLRDRLRTWMATHADPLLDRWDP